MAAFSRGLRALVPKQEYICSRCLQISTTSTAQSGHNRWSKIKHDKGATDAKKNVQRSQFARSITFASKMGGNDPFTNPGLAQVLLAAKKAGLPKASMEAAVARGQGKSTTGLALESLTIEAIMPPTVAMVIDAETDNKNRTIMELRKLIKSHGGTCTPISYLFQRKGMLRFEKDERNLGVDEVLDEAIEAGAEEIETDHDGNIIVWTEPNKVTSAAQALQTSLGLKVESSDIIWDANEDTKVPVETPSLVKALSEFVAAVQENHSVLGVYANAAQGAVEDDIWEDLEGRLGA